LCAQILIYVRNVFKFSNILMIWWFLSIQKKNNWFNNSILVIKYKIKLVEMRIKICSKKSHKFSRKLSTTKILDQSQIKWMKISKKSLKKKIWLISFLERVNHPRKNNKDQSLFNKIWMTLWKYFIKKFYNSNRFYGTRKLIDLINWSIKTSTCKFLLTH